MRLPSLSGLKQGPSMFKQAFGPIWGPRCWRAFFSVIVISIVISALGLATGAGKNALASLSAVFTGSTPLPTGPSIPTAKTQNCAITGGTNYGSQTQNCSN